MNNNITEISISEIQISDRFRKDHGDLTALAKSIEEVGLLQPIGVTPDKRLVFGERRLRAIRDILGRETIPARIIDIDSILLGQYAENEYRKDFTLSERVAIVNALRSFSHGGDRKSIQLRNSAVDSLTVNDAAKRVGFGKDSFYKAKEAIERGVPDLVDAMDKGELSINAAHTLAKAEPDEQKECLQTGFNGKKPTAHFVEKSLQEIRCKVRPATLPLGPLTINRAIVGDCRDLIPTLPDNSINLAVTSPPYADQRKGIYPGIPEAEYPAFTVDWMGKLWDKLTDDGAVLVVIDPHVKNGVVAKYFLRTQVALCEAGWKMHMPQIWHKHDRAPLGRKDWPRHAYEPVLWFSKSARPFCDAWACGTPSANIGSPKYGHSKWSNGQNPRRTGTARATDVISIPAGATEKNVGHPAMFPVRLAERLIKTFCPESGTVLDPFAGSGSTLIAAKKLGHPFYGFDIMPEYVEMAQERLAAINGVDKPDDRDFDYYRNELMAILEDCLDAGSGYSKSCIRGFFDIFGDSHSIKFDAALNSMPKRLRDYYESLPLTLAA